jgi:hypothetical protein
MTYPEGEMRYVWDGRGMKGPGATCSISSTAIALLPRWVFRRFLGWPEIVIPPADVTVVERLLFGRYRFRSCKRLIDGACFRPTRGGDVFESGLLEAGLWVVEIQREQKLRWELRMLWNQMRWGGRVRARGRLRLLP